MNKVIMMGRLTRDPETRYSQAAEPVAVVRFGIAVNRRFKREGQPDADFFDCTAFGKQGENIAKFFAKGRMILVSGSLQNHSWDDQQTGQKRFKTDVIVDEFHFPESKASAESAGFNTSPSPQSGGQAGSPNSGFMQLEQNIDDEDLPF